MQNKCEKLLTRVEFSAVLDALKQPVIVLDVSGQIVYYNAAWPAIYSSLGQKGAHWGLGQSFFDFCTGDASGQAIHAGLRNVIDGAQDSFTLAYPLGADGGGGWYLLRARRTLIDGKIMVVVVYDDITDRKAAETALRARNEWLERSIEGSSDGIWDWNLVTNELIFSAQCKRMIGYSEDDELPQLFSTFEEYLHPDDYQPTLLAIQRHINQGGIYDVEYRLRTKQGDYRWFRARGKVVNNDRGEPMRMAGSLQDVTELKAAQLALQESEERARSILETVVDGIVTADEHGVIQSANSAIERITGFAPHELVGQNIHVLIPEDQRAPHDQAMQRYIRTGVPRVIGIGRRVEMLRKDGEIEPIHITLGEFQSGGRRIFTAVLRSLSPPAPPNEQPAMPLALGEAAVAATMTSAPALG